MTPVILRRTELVNNKLNIEYFLQASVTFPSGDIAHLSRNIVPLIRPIISSTDSHNEIIGLVTQRNVEFITGLFMGLFNYKQTMIIDPRQNAHCFKDILNTLQQVTYLHDSSTKVLCEQLAKASRMDTKINLSEHCKSQVDDNNCENRYNKKMMETLLGDIVIFTSGSTGNQKAVIIDGHDLEQRINSEIKWFELTPADNILGILPFSFDVGLTQLLGTLFAGANFCIAKSWLPSDIIKQIQQNNITGLALTPMVWKTLLQYPDQESLWKTLNTLRYITLSGGSLPPQTLAHIMSQLNGPKFIKTYGQSEFFRISSLRTLSFNSKISTVGQAYPGVSVEIRDKDGNPCVSNSEGEIYAQGLGRMRGYLSNDHANKNHVNLNLWHKTGDRGFLDEDGFLTVLGRFDEMVKIFDQRIYPEEVAKTIDVSLNISDTEVVAINHNDNLKLVAFHTTAFSSEKSLSAIRSKLRKSLANHWLPSQFITIKKMPATSSGKTDKQQLKVLALDILNR